MSPTALKIKTPAPEVFVNQQWGKHHGFRLIVQAHGPVAAGARLHAQLVYADNLEEVSCNSRSCSKRRKYKMLQVLDEEAFVADGEAELLCRINDVSRNHKGRLFRLRLTCQGPDGKAYASCTTTPIKVISKQPKQCKRMAATSTRGTNPSKRSRRQAAASRTPAQTAADAAAALPATPAFTES